jgi:DNA-binding transcriptional regulator GbsR (MarR family)
MAEVRAAETEAALREIEDRFLACWGGIAALWGVSPTFGRIHGLLLLSPKPLDAEAIRHRLGISHGSCSTGLGTLVAWGVLRRVHPPGKRRACYAAERDGWTWLRTCARERRRREIQPLLDSLREVRTHAETAATQGRERRHAGHRDLAETRDRIRAFVGFMDEFAAMVDAFLAAPAPGRRRGS